MRRTQSIQEYRRKNAIRQARKQERVAADRFFDEDDESRSESLVRVDSATFEAEMARDFGDEEEEPPRADRNEDDVMTLTEAARYLKTTRQTVAASVKRGELPCVMLAGRYYRFSRKALEAAMSEKRS